MALLHPEKVGVYAETQGDRDTRNFAPGVMLKGLNDIGLRWYYTYANKSPNPFESTIDNSGTLSNPNSIQTSIIQLPSIWDADPLYQNSTTLNFAKANGGLIIGYNEPWNGFNNWWPGNPMTPTQALDAWPALMALGNRLASPSISFSSFTQSNDWLAQFMSGVASRGYRVDVINVHFYSSTPSTAVADFQSYLQGVHNLYNKPIVITEWALADWGNQNGSATATFSPLQQADFAQAACAMLDGLSFVEKHAWFNSAEGVGYTWQNSGLLNADGSPTLVGQRFAQMLGGSTSGSTTSTVIEFYKNGILVGTATKVPTGALYPILSLANNTEAATANFGATAMSFLPNGMTSWDGSQIGTGGTGGTTSAIALSTTDKASSVVLSNGNLTATQSGSSSGAVRGVQSGVADRYFEVKFGTIAAGAGSPGIGVANASQALTNSYPGDPNGVGWFSSGYTEWPQSGTGYNFGNYAAGDVLGVLLKASSVQFYKNGALVGTAVTLPAGRLYPIILLANDTDSATVNFGATPLSFLPAGSASWDGSQVKTGGGGATGGGTTTVGGFVCDGDSLTFGQAQDAGITVVSYPAQLNTLAGKPVVNLGISGETVVQMNNKYATAVAPLFNPSSANILVLQGSENDYSAGATPAALDASVRSYCAKARATGFKVWLQTMAALGLPPGVTGQASLTAFVNAVNADRRANWAQYCDGLIDVAADPRMSDPTNRTYFQSDQTHWTTAGCGVVAGLVKTAIMG